MEMAFYLDSPPQRHPSNAFFKSFFSTIFFQFSAGIADFFTSSLAKLMDKAITGRGFTAGCAKG
jgi:hypothetical protein